MGIEIERKFLVTNDTWKSLAGDGRVCRQGYLAKDTDKTVRVRIIGSEAFLTIKGATNGIRRSEFEYSIQVSDAEALLRLCGNQIEKTRYNIDCCGMLWELDVFSGDNEGLIMAEIELESEEQEFVRPEWAGDEVSGDVRYYNAYLASHPFSQWEQH